MFTIGLTVYWFIWKNWVVWSTWVSQNNQYFQVSISTKEPIVFDWLNTTTGPLLCICFVTDGLDCLIAIIIIFSCPECSRTGLNYCPWTCWASSTCNPLRSSVTTATQDCWTPPAATRTFNCCWKKPTTPTFRNCRWAADASLATNDPTTAASRRNTWTRAPPARARASTGIRPSPLRRRTPMARGGISLMASSIRARARSRLPSPKP